MLKRKDVLKTEFSKLTREKNSSDISDFEYNATALVFWWLLAGSPTFPKSQ